MPCTQDRGMSIVLSRNDEPISERLRSLQPPPERLAAMAAGR
jgi:hypothetical protein